MKQHARDLITGELTLDYFLRRWAAGWRVVSMEWAREANEAPTTLESPNVLVSPDQLAVPFGLQVSTGKPGLEEDSWEAGILLLILDQIVREKRVTEIASQLNLAGYKTREGTAWSPISVFDLLPRLIEVAPAVLKSEAWAERRANQRKPN